MINNRYRIELLPNGFYRLYDYHCQWDGLYNRDGSKRHGNTSFSHLCELTPNWESEAGRTIQKVVIKNKVDYR